MLKLIGHVVVFVVGAGIGVFWGVHHPEQAADLSNAESAKVEQAVAAAKTKLMEQVVEEQGMAPDAATAGHLSKYQQWLQAAKNDMAAAQNKLNGQ